MWYKSNFWGDNYTADPLIKIFIVSVRVPIGFNRPLKNVFEAADARQEQAKKRSLCLINEHFEPVFKTTAATQVVFQRPVKSDLNNGLLSPDNIYTVAMMVILTNYE